MEEEDESQLDDTALFAIDLRVQRVAKKAKVFWGMLRSRLLLLLCRLSISGWWRLRRRRRWWWLRSTHSTRLQQKANER